jgi:uncharacterized membrane protein YdbT with pleckstrin-like domain
MNQMNYIQQSLNDNEELVHVAHFHWMYSVHAVINIIFSFVLAGCIVAFAIKFQPILFGTQPGYDELSWIDKVRVLHAGVKILAFFVILMGLMKFAKMMIDRATTEIAITNKRLVYKRGLVARYVGEMNIDRIEGVNVLQGVFGRIFGYGSIMVRGMGIGEVVLPPIADPIVFRKAIEKARSV